MTNVPLTMKTTPPTMTMRNPRLNMTSKRFSSRSPSPLFQLSMMAYVPTATRSPVFEKNHNNLFKISSSIFSNQLHVMLLTKRSRKLWRKQLLFSTIMMVTAGFTIARACEGSSISSGIEEKEVFEAEILFP